ncbi:MAG: alpha/beta hydrolase [Chloroflexota bacterium]
MTQLHFLDPNPGGAPAVLLLHGMGANCASWSLQIPRLIEAGFRPIAPDAPGFSQSPYDGTGWTIPRVSAMMMDLLTELGTGPAHVVGISMGGVIAQQLARDQPQMISRLVLVNTFSALRPATLGGWAYFLWRLVLVHTLGLPAQAKVVARRIFHVSEQEDLRKMLITAITQSDPRAYRAAMRSLGLFNSKPWLIDIRIPTLVITADQDTTVNPILQGVLARGISCARQVVITGAGHAVTIDQPEKFNRELLRFLSE